METLTLELTDGELTCLLEKTPILPMHKDAMSLIVKIAVASMNQTSWVARHPEKMEWYKYDICPHGKVWIGCPTCNPDYKQ